MSTSLYRKYRPKKLSEVAGQDHITSTLKNALTKGQISHAYLFTGPRGVGKTSVARILAHEVNELAYQDDASDIDIVEIDAASNRRIDEIRELREMAYMAPVSSKYKVYIIDEVHMLTKEAFNALLKLLEEPPAHVIFILATTELQKLPDTIISRTQRYSFRPISSSAIIDQLGAIAKKEKIDIDTPATELIAQHSSGSLRDALSLLDQARSQSKKITESTLIEMLGMPPKESIEELIELTLSTPNVARLSQQLSSLYDQGYQPAYIAKDISANLRDIVLKNNKPKQNPLILDLLKKLLSVPSSLDPNRYLEIVLIETASSLETPALAISKSEPIQEKEVEVKPKKIEKKDLDDDLWLDILSDLKSKHNTLYSVVRMAKPEIKDNKLTLTFEFEFHVKRISEANNFKMLSETVDSLSGQHIEIEYKVSANTLKKDVKIEPTHKQDSTKDKELEAINNIFGGAEPFDE
ncbi:MAG TPA: DNA polymerase III subunit gamma/tau [Candidatus Sulfotelmatobacter sp.]|nr:DNA polymerase III subunit gamma/tau [Candidatus Sulfotelmatobacter sp.]